MRVEQIAQACHEANRILQQATNDPAVSPPWDEAPQDQRDSAIAGVRFALDEPDAPDNALHDAWYDYKRTAGWVYGPQKNPVTKEHPCLVPFEQLPPEQRAKDTLFRAIVKALAPLAEAE
jgi:hypothetical protein